MDTLQQGPDLLATRIAHSTIGPENDFSSWYIAEEGIDSSGVAREVFADALVHFSAELTKDGEKIKWITDTKHGNLGEMLASVRLAQADYAKRKESSKVQETLVQLSEKVLFYSGVMDVLVNHYPEYTSLAWGAMKFLFIGVVNHQKLVCRLSTGLCDIGDMLPRAELILRLYPTAHIRQTIAGLYAHVVKFLIRALRWYKDSKPKHMIDAIIRPTELRYDDLLVKISASSRNMAEFASASSHAEQRDMHTSIRQQSLCHKETQASIEQLTVLVLQMKNDMASEHAINASARIELRQRLSEVQLTQFMGHISVEVLPDPFKAFQTSLFMHSRHRQRLSAMGPPFWLDPKVQRWNTSQESSLVMIKGTWKLRFHLRGFCTDVIASLLHTKVPVIWALHSIDPPQTITTNAVSAVELIKYLIAQVVRINAAIHVDSALVPCLNSYMAAKTESEWMNLLASLLSGNPLLYIVLDVEVLSNGLAEPTQGFWASAFHEIFSGLQARDIKTVIKVIMLSYGSPLLRVAPESNWRHLVVPVGGMRQCKGLGGQPYSGGTLALSRLTIGNRSCRSRDSSRKPSRLRKRGGIV